MTNAQLVNRFTAVLLTIVVTLAAYILAKDKTNFVCTFENTEGVFTAEYSQVMSPKTMILVSKDERKFLLRRDRLEECVEK